jgi:hypothetical protein
VVREDGHAGSNAIDAVEDGRVRFFPQRYAKTYLDWLGEKRDWCISRQLWWGHRIPVWTFDVPAPNLTESEIEASLLNSHSCDKYLEAFVGKGMPEGVSMQWYRSDAPGHFRTLLCVDEGLEHFETEIEALGAKRDPDVLDTWFSSALWPHATLGWPDREHNPPMQPAASQISNLKSEIEDTRRADAQPLAGESENRKPKTENSKTKFSTSSIPARFLSLPATSSRCGWLEWCSRGCTTWAMYRSSTSIFIRRFSMDSGRLCPNPKATALIRSS